MIRLRPALASALALAVLATGAAASDFLIAKATDAVSDAALKTGVAPPPSNLKAPAEKPAKAATEPAKAAEKPIPAAPAKKAPK